MNLYTVTYEDGRKFNEFAACMADAWHRHPIAWTVVQVNI